jgi:DNA-binding CsgD family transcriptional regulator
LADAARRFGPQVALFGPEMLIARAWLAAARGGHRTAIDLARRAATEARQSKQYAVEAEALHHAARFGDRTAGSRLVQLAAGLDGKLAVLYADHAVALANSDAELLDAVSLEFEAVGLLLAATDAAAQAATAHDRAGRRRLGALAAARVADLAERCGGVITPAIRAAAQPLPLSSREHEIASLVAEGLSNRDIADKLCMSVRTAEGHIYRACLKLDAADREELAALIRWPMKRA